VATPPPSPDLSPLARLAPELACSVARVSSDIALVVDADGVIRSVAEGRSPPLSANPGWVGRPWRDTATASTQHKVALLLEEALDTGVARRREVNHPGPDGQEVPVAWSAVRLGAHGSLLAVGRDLRASAAQQTRFNEAQRELERAYWQRRQIGDRHRLLYRVATDAVLLLDATDAQVIEGNAAALALFGLDLATLAGAKLGDLLPAASRPALVGLLAEARRSGRTAEARADVGAGTLVAELSATPLVGARARVLLRLRSGEPGDDVLIAMADEVNETTDGAAVVGPDDRLQLANAAFVNLLGHGDDPLASGRALADVAGADHARWTALLAWARAEGLAARQPVRLDSGQVVEATAARLTEGEPGRVGLVVGTPAGRPAASALPTDELYATLQDVAGQLGRKPMAELMRAVERATERQLIRTAVQRAGGLLPVAADMLGLRPEGLALRMRRLGLSVPVLGVGDAPASIN
jgi:transcriptional regulator PpsR